MKYMGSKARIAKDISPIINKLITDNGITVYIEPFVGGANMIQHIECEKRHGYDNNKYLIAFWTRIQQGWNPLTEVEMNREYYGFVRDNPDHYEPEYVALCGFCATYNAKWFGGYAGTVKTKINTYRNYYDEAVRNVLKQRPHIQSVQFTCSDYQKISVEGALIYCDPPYQGTTGYKDDFDHEAYWEWVRHMSEKNIVLCSEYSAPSDFECIWSKELTTTLDNSSRSKSVEKLFIYKKEREEKTLELKVNAVALPDPITFNYDELKTELLQKVSVYETMVYGEDQIKEAKADRANLNRLKKALNDERIRREKEYMQPFNQFKAQIQEIISIIDKPVAVIDRQVKGYEEQQKQEKLQKIRECYAETITNKASLIGAGIKLEQFFDDKWLNASVSMKAIKDSIDTRIAEIEKDLDVIRCLPAYAFEAEQAYLTSLDLAKAVSEAHWLQEQAEKKAAWQAELKQKQEACGAPDFSKLKPGDRVSFAGASETSEDIPCTPWGADCVVEPSRQWIGFQAFLSVDEAKALGQYMKTNGIKYKAI